MIDASGKPSSNLISMVWQWLGDYEECQSIGDQKAHYCQFEALNAEITLPEHNNWNVTIPVAMFRWGLCVPRQCNASSLQTIIISFISDTKAPIISVTPNGTSTTCLPQHIPLTSAAIAVIAICSCIAFLVLLSTVIDYNHEHLKRCICGAEPIPLQETSIDSQSTLDESQDYAQLESSINMQKRRRRCSCLTMTFV
jgi:hypothetical protein